MIKNVGVGIVALALALGLAACSSKKSDKDIKDNTKGGATAGASTAELCAKAKTCVDGLIAADPENTKDLAGTWKAVDATTDDAAKRDLCKQLLEGAGYNPKAPASCK